VSVRALDPLDPHDRLDLPDLDLPDHDLPDLDLPDHVAAMSTRKLIVLALLCGIALLVAFTVQLVLIR
jgi:hypothetical protein